MLRKQLQPSSKIIWQIWRVPNAPGASAKTDCCLGGSIGDIMQNINDENMALVAGMRNAVNSSSSTFMQSMYWRTQEESEKFDRLLWRRVQVCCELASTCQAC